MVVEGELLRQGVLAALGTSGILQLPQPKSPRTPKHPNTNYTHTNCSQHRTCIHAYYNEDVYLYTEHEDIFQVRKYGMNTALGKRYGGQQKYIILRYT